MDSQFTTRVEQADSDVQRHPGHRKPPRPTIAAKHKYPGNDRNQLDYENPDVFPLKGASPELIEMNRKRADSSNHKKPSDSRNCDWAVSHRPSLLLRILK